MHSNIKSQKINPIQTKWATKFGINFSFTNQFRGLTFIVMSKPLAFVTSKLELKQKDGCPIKFLWFHEQKQFTRVHPCVRKYEYGIN